jgi:hypothetical protein
MEDTLQTEFRGRRGRLFWMALRFSLLNVVTLGIYRFWMKTRLRRYYWSSVRPGGLPLEYTGLPLEKLLGFLIAVSFLAVYIGLVNLLLMFLSLTLLQDDLGAYVLSFLGLVPVFFFALYRRRRYVLARTRWAGLRFGLEPGAWGYAWRAVLHWLAAILSLGLLWPRKTFWLEKYRADRTRYGTLAMTQGGRWTMLYPAFLPLLAGGLATLGIIAGAYAAGTARLLLALPLSLLLLGYGMAHWRAGSFRLLTGTKRLGEIGFTANPRPWRVFRIYLFGGLLIGLTLILLTVALGALATLMLGLGSGALAPVLAQVPEVLRALPLGVKAALAVLVYFQIFVFWEVLGHVFLTLPLWRHFAETLTVTNAGALAGVRQGAADAAEEAGGFAEALDVGAAI